MPGAPCPPSDERPPVAVTHGICPEADHPLGGFGLDPLSVVGFSHSMVHVVFTANLDAFQNKTKGAS
jgi:hypothetical protein